MRNLGSKQRQALPSQEGQREQAKDRGSQCSNGEAVGLAWKNPCKPKNRRWIYFWLFNGGFPALSSENVFRQYSCSDTSCQYV